MEEGGAALAILNPQFSIVAFDPNPCHPRNPRSSPGLFCFFPVSAIRYPKSLPVLCDFACDAPNQISTRSGLSSKNTTCSACDIRRGTP